ncbi:unnamed protein product [Schistocephalus solidus]|uniref:Uncharacterized protein n=1 Tax=Schistocephalus solidus TaxID=70667 RepID=A0A183TPX5_SCHSO|nr:unnamed protein product [Schistocephalus solidus]
MCVYFCFGDLRLVHNSHLWLLEVGFFPANTPRATVTTGGLNQVSVSAVVCVFTPGTSAPYPLFLPSPVLPTLPPFLLPPHSPLPSYFSSTPSSLFLFLLLLLPLLFSLSPHPSHLLHARKVLRRGQHAIT